MGPDSISGVLGQGFFLMLLLLLLRVALWALKLQWSLWKCV